MGEAIGNPMNRIAQAARAANLAQASTGIPRHEVRSVSRIAAAAGLLGPAALGGAETLGTTNGERMHTGPNERDLNPDYRRAGRL